MYKGKIINFELLHLNDYRVLVDEITQASVQGYNAIIGLLLMDGFLYKNDPEFFKNMKLLQDKAHELGIKKIILVPGMCENFKKQLEENNIWFDIVYYDFWQHIVYQSYKHIELPEWNKHTDKFLMLGGIPSRTNRIRLLSKFYNKNLLTRGEWSFFSPHTPSDIKWCRDALKEYSDKEYEMFLKNCERGVDSLYEDAKNYSRAELFDLKESFNNDWCRDPSYINPSIFSSTSLSVISEGYAYEPATDFKYLTEKTWRTILNKHPFVMAGYVEQSEYARNRGLRTFNQYMLIPDYDLIEDDEQRMNAVVQNVEYFLNNIDQYSDQLNEDIEYNYNVFNSVTEYNKSVLENFSIEYQIPETEIAKWFEHKSFLHLMRALDAD